MSAARKLSPSQRAKREAADERWRQREAAKEQDERDRRLVLDILAIIAERLDHDRDDPTLILTCFEVVKMLRDKGVTI